MFTEIESEKLPEKLFTHIKFKMENVPVTVKSRKIMENYKKLKLF